MGKRYTREEIDQIQALVTDGLTDREIAERLGRSEDGIRNIRHRKKLRAATTRSLQSLIHKEKEVNERVSHMLREIESLETRRKNLLEVLHADEKTLSDFR